MGESGAGNEDRTRDLKITNLALYQLSYPGANTIIDVVRRPFNFLLFRIILVRLSDLTAVLSS